MALSGRRRLTRGASPFVVIAAYAAVVVWLTWPLAVVARTHVLGSSALFDTMAVTWALAHQSVMLVSDPLHVAHGNIYHPTPNSLFYVEAGSGAVPWFAPTFLATGDPILGLNVFLLTSVALTAAGLHGVVRRWGGSHAAGMVAAATFVASPLPWALFPWAPNYAALLYLPWIIWATAAPLRRLGHVLGLGILYAAQGLTSLYLLPAVFLPPCAVVAARLVSPPRRAAARRLAAAVAVGLLLVVPVCLGYMHVRLDEPRLFEQTYWPLRTDPMRLALMAKVPAWVLPGFVSVVTPFWIVLLGGAATWLVRRRAGRAVVEVRPIAHVLLWIGCSFALALDATWNAIGTALPGFDFVRAPRRLGLLVVVACGLLVGLAFREIESAIRRRWHRRGAALAMGLAVLVVAGTAYSDRRPPDGWGWVRATPRRALLRVQRLDPSILAAIRAGPPGALVQLPATGKGLVRAVRNAVAEFASIDHGRSILNGYGSYWPSGFPERMALVGRIPSREAVLRLQREADLALVLVDLPMMLPAARSRWLALATRGGNDVLTLTTRTGDTLLFAVRAHPSGPHPG